MTTGLFWYLWEKGLNRRGSRRNMTMTEGLGDAVQIWGTYEVGIRFQGGVDIVLFGVDPRRGAGWRGYCC